MLIQSERGRVKAPREACIEEPFGASNQNHLKVGLDGFPPIKGIGIDRSDIEPIWECRSGPYRKEVSFKANQGGTAEYE